MKNATSMKDEDKVGSSNDDFTLFSDDDMNVDD